MTISTIIKPTLLSLGLASIMGCATSPTATSATVNQPTSQTGDSSATVYYNGNIITMEGDNPQMAEALVTQAGKIAYVGTLDTAQSKYNNAAQVNLNDKTLLPGFIDPHSHFDMVSNTMGQVNLNPPPVGKVDSIDKMLAALKAYKKDNNIADGEWIYGWGYDESQLTEQRHPTKGEIDKALPNNPVYLQHTSGHMGVANSKGLAAMEVTADSKNPEGGNIARVKGSSELNGLVQETAMYPFVRHMLEVLEPNQAKFFEKTQDYYAENGLTTAHNGSTARNTIEFFQKQSDAGKLKIDLVALAGVSDLDENLADKDFVWKTYQNGFKVQGTKIVADGSPQGKTAYFSQPYITPVPDCEKDCRGLPSVSQDALNEMFVKAYARDNQLFIHNNGDGATDMIIKAHEYAVKKTGQAADKDRRTVPIHAQFARPDQLQAFKKYNMMPSFFTNHTYFWGDVHVENLGEKRANFSSPIATADKMGLKYTNHSDDTVTPVDPLFTVWSAVNRTSRSGKIIGKDQRASPYQALKAITTNAAYEYYEEDSKGTLTQGKLADLVILDANPLTIAPNKLKDINVVTTIKEGKTIYQRPAK
ncbi:amidohydrolase [Psychrobacter sp. AOP22-C1-22]|uniref:amidohydrolase n=1 Tax=unclassified Psychrobacter TaxID=196806 RepID=UPI001787AEB1|nr:amidohydrolase [Psychrobacter sp. FME6]MBE0405550.1 amidohydrolase [Psychrobacter sp. FME6]